MGWAVLCVRWVRERLLYGPDDRLTWAHLRILREEGCTAGCWHYTPDGFPRRGMRHSVSCAASRRAE